ncbi:hypothetical protein CK203_082182 [Vitis vinifera]|uniref:Uncharacterized protein n=1 Tax=Vitis vinifera TaxID=29760 RepID=A0A438CNA5_VITVI|nr:hypothetical protein CK203_082182 [Vitis vinifera]
MGGMGKTTLLNRPANVEKVQQVLFNKLEIPSNNWEVGIPPVIDGNKSKVVFTT